MFKNTDENKMLNVRRAIRSITRSDGSTKIYGWTVNGELLTVVMTKKPFGNYDTKEIRINWKTIFYRDQKEAIVQ